MQGSSLGLGKKIMEALKNGSTLQAEAQNLGIEVGKLEKMLKGRMTKKTFRKLKKMSERNVILDEKKKRRAETEAQKDVGTTVETPSDNYENNQQSQVETSSDDHENNPQSQVETSSDDHENNPQSQVETSNDDHKNNPQSQENPKWKPEEMEIERKYDKLQSVIEALRVTKAEWEKSYEWRRWLQKQLPNKHQVTAEILEAYELEDMARREYDLKREEYYALKEEIKRQQKKIIFLVAPGYRGELPRFGRLISCRRFPHIRYLKVENRSELLEPVTKSNIKAMGYENPYHIKATLDFVKLVVHYVVYNPKETKLYILCNDSRVYKVLESQGIKF